MIEQSKGTIVHDPVAYATGRRKLAKLRVLWPDALDVLTTNRDCLTAHHVEILDATLRKRHQDQWDTTGIPTSSIQPIFTLLENVAAKNNNLAITNFQSKVRSELVITRIRPNWAIVRVPIPLIENARTQIGLKEGQKPAIPSWGPHITIVRGERVDRTKWGLQEQEEINFSFDTEVKEGRNRYFYLDVYSPELEQVRLNLGIRRKPTPDFHITIGCIR